MQYQTVVELEKLIEFREWEFFAESPFIYRRKLSFYDIDSYFVTIFGAEDTANKSNVRVITVVVQDTNYALKTSLALCEADDESFYFDFNEQYLYVHLEHSINILDVQYAHIGVIFGYCNTGVTYYDDIEYLPEVLSVPILDIETIPGQYNRIELFGGNIVFKNEINDYLKKKGNFDDVHNDSLSGNIIRILYGTTADAYADLLEFAQFIISQARVGTNTATLDLTDRRKELSLEILDDTFSSDDYPYIEDNNIGRYIPKAYGLNYGVPGICLDANAEGDKTFKVPPIHTLFDVWVQQPNKTWLRIVPISVDDINGVIEIDEADAYEGGDDANTLLNVKVDGIFMISECTAIDIIKEINDDILGLNYDTDNYDIVEFESEGLYLDDIGVYIDKQTTIQGLYEKLQGASNFGFRYEINYDLRTIRVDYKNRAVAQTIDAIDIMNLDNAPYDILDNDYISHNKIFYKPTRFSNTHLSYNNNDYYDAVKREYHIPIFKEFYIEAYEQQTAIDKSVILLEDWQKARFRISIVVNGLEYFTLRIYDIVTVDFTTYIYSNNIDITTQEAIKRIFIGIQRCQIIGISPDFLNANVTLKLRQCDESENIERIVNNKSLFYDHMLYYDGGYFLDSWLNYSGSGEVTSDLDGTVKIIKIGNNAGDDMQWVYNNERAFYFDETDLYEVRAIVKTTAGAGTCFIGIEGLATNKTTMVNTAGANLHTSQHYFAAENVAVGSAWTEYKGYFQGRAGAGNGGQHNDIYDPGTVHTDVIYMRPVLIVNYNGAAGITYIKEFQLRKITNT